MRNSNNTQAFEVFSSLTFSHVFTLKSKVKKLKAFFGRAAGIAGVFNPRLQN